MNMIIKHLKGKQYYPVRLSTIDGIPLTSFTNAAETMESGIKVWDFVAMHAHLSPPWIINNGDKTYTFTVDIADIKRHKIDLLKRQTYEQISQRFPEWKQLQYIQYAIMHERKLRGEILSDREIAAIKAIKGASTDGDMYKKVVNHLKWMQDCIDIHNTKESEIANVTTPIAASNMSIICTYPPAPY